MVKRDHSSVMLWNALCGRLHGIIHNYFISNMDKTKNRELKVFPVSHYSVYFFQINKQ